MQGFLHLNVILPLNRPPKKDTYAFHIGARSIISWRSQSRPLKQTTFRSQPT